MANHFRLSGSVEFKEFLTTTELNPFLSVWVPIRCMANGMGQYDLASSNIHRLQSKQTARHLRGQCKLYSTELHTGEDGYSVEVTVDCLLG